MGIAAIAVALAACADDGDAGDDSAADGGSAGDDGGSTGDDGGSAGDGASADGASVDDTAGGDGGGEGGGSLGNDHGVVTIEFKRAENEPSNPYAGTVRVSITLAYLECLTDFYAANPSWTQDGPDGAGVFGDAAGPSGLCASDPEHAECTVAQITQNVDVANALAIDYMIAGELEDRRLRFGPLPTEDLAACADSLSPTVRIGSNGAIRGMDASGAILWETKSFSPDIAMTDQGQPLTIRGGVPG